MVKIKYTSCVNINVDGKTFTQLVHDKKGNEAYKMRGYNNANHRASSHRSLKLQQQQDLEKQLSDLTDHFDSKLESLNHMILKDLTEKINKIEKSVVNIGKLHDTLLEKIACLEVIISQMKNREGVNIQIEDIENLNKQISLLQAKVSVIQEQKILLISRMTEFHAIKQHINDSRKQGKQYNPKTFNGEQNTEKELVTLMSKLTTTSNLNSNLIYDIIPIASAPRYTKKRFLSKNVVARLKFIHIKNKFLKVVARKM